jgi:opacity protein-like surface antigen
LVALIFFLSCLAAIQPARADVPSRSWNLHAYGFAARYHHAIGYLPGAGFGLAVERRLGRNQLGIAAGLEYTRATQVLTLIGGSPEIYTDLYQSFVAARGVWQPQKLSRLAFVLELQTGLLLLRSRPWTFDAGTFGKVAFPRKSEAKLVLGWGAGASFRVTRHVAVLFSVKQNFSRFAQRQIDVAETTRVWRPFWHYVAGLSWQF